jgi:flagellar FliJ protein
MLIGLAQGRLDVATQRLRQLDSEQRDANLRLRMLLEYQRDYQARLGEELLKGISQPGWRNFRLFMSTLGHAIAEQNRAVDRSRERKEAGHAQWHAERRALKSFDILMQRYIRADRLRASRREQREQDEQNIRGRFHDGFGSIGEQH